MNWWVRSLKCKRLTAVPGETFQKERVTEDHTFLSEILTQLGRDLQDTVTSRALTSTGVRIQPLPVKEGAQPICARSFHFRDCYKKH